MQQQARHFRVGLITLLGGGLFVSLLVFILGSGLYAKSVTYYILFQENVKGMVIGSKVNFQGVPVGVVRDIRFADGLTEVEVSVDPTRAVIQEKTLARLDRLLVTGQVTVELEGYEQSSRPLPPGAVIRPKQDPMHSLTMSLPEVVDEVLHVFSKLEGTVDRINDLLGEQNRSHVSGILANLDATTRQLPAQLDALTAQAGQAAAAIEASLGKVSELGPEAKDAIAELRRSLQQLQQLGAAATGLSSDVHSLLAAVRAPVLSSLQTFKTALDEVHGLARMLRLAPDSMLYGIDRRAAEPAAPAGGVR